MTPLLQQALSAVQGLPESEQNAIASIIMAELADDRQWDAQFAQTQNQLGNLALKVRKDIRAGKVSGKGFDEL